MSPQPDEQAGFRGTPNSETLLLREGPRAVALVATATRPCRWQQPHSHSLCYLSTSDGQSAGSLSKWYFLDARQSSHSGGRWA